MEPNPKIWSLIETEARIYDRLNLKSNLDYSKYFIYSIITHSTAIEGSTLSEQETQLLFDEGLTAKGKPLAEHLMNNDLKEAYDIAIKEAQHKRPITVEYLKQLNSIIMKSTGGPRDFMGEVFDTSKGDYRKCGVQAGYNGKSYMNYQKVPQSMEQLCDALITKLPNSGGLEKIYTLSFDAHLNLVTIHPWLDGNGRTGRLLMNYIQFYHDLTPTKIFKEDRADYINSLRESQDSGDPVPFREFMVKQHLKTLQEEISAHKKNNKQGFSLMF